MARRSVLLHKDDQCVAVAVGGDAHDMLIIAARLSFCPKLAAGTAPKAGKLLFHRKRKAFAIHIGEREHLFAVCVDNDRGDEPLFIEI